MFSFSDRLTTATDRQRDRITVAYTALACCSTSCGKNEDFVFFIHYSEAEMTVKDSYIAPCCRFTLITAACTENLMYPPISIKCPMS